MVAPKLGKALTKRTPAKLIMGDADLEVKFENSSWT